MKGKGGGKRGRGKRPVKGNCRWPTRSKTTGKKGYITKFPYIKLNNAAKEGGGKKGRRGGFFSSARFLRVQTATKTWANSKGGKEEKKKGRGEESDNTK